MKRRKTLIHAGILALLAAAIFLWLISSGAIVFDHSGERWGEGLYWNGYYYVQTGGSYDEGKTIAKTTDGWQINEVEGDPEHIYVVLRSFLDNYLLVREDQLMGGVRP